MQEEGAPFLRGPHLQTFIQRERMCVIWNPKPLDWSALVSPWGPIQRQGSPWSHPHLLRASFSQHIKLAWTSNPKRKETKPKWGLWQPLQADSVPHLPQPSPQACPLFGRAQGRLISPKVVTDQFSKLHENRKQTENQIHQSLSLKNSLAGRSNVLTISCCFKSF